MTIELIVLMLAGFIIALAIWTWVGFRYISNNYQAKEEVDDDT